MSGAGVLWLVLAAATTSGEAGAPLDPPMIEIPGGRVVMGDPAGGPDEVVHEVDVAPFMAMAHEVTNEMFAAFVAHTGHVTDAEHKGGGYVWPGSWRFETGADWRHPEGPHDSIEGRARHPISQRKTSVPKSSGSARAPIRCLPREKTTSCEGCWATWRAAPRPARAAPCPTVRTSPTG